MDDLPVVGVPVRSGAYQVGLRARGEFRPAPGGSMVSSVRVLTPATALRWRLVPQPDFVT